MQTSDSPNRYGAIARWLHWTMFTLIAVQIVGGIFLEDLPKGSALRGFAFDGHETVGIVAILLVLARIAWKLSHPGPAPEGTGLQQALAKAGHVALYALMIAVPVVGYAMVDAKGYDVAFFGWSGPDFLAKDADLAKSLNQLHERLAWLLTGLVAAHVAAAFWHHFGLRDGTMRRMLPARG